MTCPKCKKGKIGVIDTFSEFDKDNNPITARHRKCKKCGHELYTMEQAYDAIKVAIILSDRYYEHRRKKNV